MSFIRRSAGVFALVCEGSRRSKPYETHANGERDVSFPTRSASAFALICEYSRRSNTSETHASGERGMLFLMRSAGVFAMIFADGGQSNKPEYRLLSVCQSVSINRKLAEAEGEVNTLVAVRESSISF